MSEKIQHLSEVIFKKIQHFIQPIFAVTSRSMAPKWGPTKAWWLHELLLTYLAVVAVAAGPPEKSERSERYLLPVVMERTQWAKLSNIRASERSEQANEQ